MRGEPGRRERVTPVGKVNRQSSPVILGRAKELIELPAESGCRTDRRFRVKRKHRPKWRIAARHEPDQFANETRSNRAQSPATCGYVVDCTAMAWRTEKRLLLCRFPDLRVPTPPSGQQITLYGPQRSDQVSGAHNPPVWPNLNAWPARRGGVRHVQFRLFPVGRQDVAPAHRTDACFHHRPQSPDSSQALENSDLRHKFGVRNRPCATFATHGAAWNFRRRSCVQHRPAANSRRGYEKSPKWAACHERIP